MNCKLSIHPVFGFIAVSIVLTLPLDARAVDVDAAKALARQNSCFICHSTEKDKVGPSFTKISAKYRANAGAEAKLEKHLVSGEMAKFPDGHEEHHKIINTKDKAEIKNLVDWILSL